MPKRIRDVMTPLPWTVPASCPLPEAARRMRARDVHEVFVVDDGTFCGVLTDTDIIVVAIASGRPPAQLTAGDCHVPDAPRLHADQPVPDALAYLQLHQLHRVAVVDGDQLVGSVWRNEIEQVERPDTNKVYACRHVGPRMVAHRRPTRPAAEATSRPKRHTEV